ncbi:peptidyl-alpha-hydroxyglycine alpha-amidating lyase family protein [Streptosporangium sp. NPDC000239]|uniref:peptidyl-alpha-hydroxyglycine alpha-amidating lyase family protein n=1 Tax=Streptosporangium sp. NPDC000239 TaxID=3154248 RepID=UPI003320CAA7
MAMRDATPQNASLQNDAAPQNASQGGTASRSGGPSCRNGMVPQSGTTFQNGAASRSDGLSPRDGATSRSDGPSRGGRVRRRVLLAAVPLLAAGAAGLLLRGNPPRGAVVSEAVDRTVPPGSTLTPWGRVPAGVTIGSGVAVTGTGEVLLLHRGGGAFAADRMMDVDPVVVLDAGTGEVTRSWGAGMFASPHGVSVDGKGRVWVTDVTTNHVTVFTGDGRLERTIGHDYGFGLDTCLAVRNTLTNLRCTGDPYIFARPTDVVAGGNGRAFVSDGYRNSRVGVFDAAGRFAGAWGELGDRDGAFSIPHGIALRGNGDVVVADRRNARVQVFSADGRHLATHSSAAIGRPYDVAVGPGDVLYVLDGGDALDEEGGRHRGYVVALAGDGSVTRRWALADQDADPHQLAVGPAGEIYVAALNGPPLWRWAPR